MNLRISLLLVTASLLGLTECSLGQERKKQTGDPLDQIGAATAHMNRGARYLLRYKFRQGEVLRYRSEHVLTKSTSMASFSDKLSSRSQNEKSYKVTNIDSLGQMTFVHINNRTKTETRLNDKEPIAYDSESSEEPPAGYHQVAETIGAVLFKYQIKPNGTIVERKCYFRDWDLGTGKAIVPFPEKAIPVGYSWYVNEVTTAKYSSGRVQQIKLRLCYKLEAVKDGIARLSMETEILTPITPKLRSQILQDVIEGERLFDIGRGRFVKQEIRWNHRVHGFEGKDSMTEYLGRYTEVLITEKAKTQSVKVALPARQVSIRTIDSKPILRRPDR